MPVPDFQTVMLPLLRLAAGGQEHTMAEAISALADAFKLTEDERAELLPYGGQRRFNNRVYWAKAHLRAAGLVVSPRRGRFLVTPAGEAVLAAPPARIDMNFLRKYPGYVAFLSGPSSPAPEVKPPVLHGLQTPDEIISSAAKLLDDELASEVLARVVAAPSDFLETLVIDLLKAMHYGGADFESGAVVGGAGDDGIDGIIKQDMLGLDLIYVQAKRWTTRAVQPGDIRDFIGSLQIKSASRGVFITTSSFTADAKATAGKSGKQIVLIDGAKLARFMIEFNVGVRERARYVLKEIDADFFDAG
jgi:restriction system protein